MTQAKHTPGPWHVGQLFRQSNVAAPTLPIVAHMDGCGDKTVASVYLFSSEEAEETARLIAAAPELLEALEKIDANAAENPEWIRRVARAAIAKATVAR